VCHQGGAGSSPVPPPNLTSARVAAVRAEESVVADEGDGEGPGSAIVKAAGATGLPSTIKGKVQRAILRLVVGIFDPDNIERIRANASTVEGRSRIDAMVAEEIGKQALCDPVFMERAKARFLGELAQKQQNVEAVATKAQKKAETAPDAEEAPAEPDAEPSDDWMNAFTREAELASSDELRERLGAVLAGEARKPGTYSRSTVRLIAELEQEVLLAFQSVLEQRIGDAIICDATWTEGAELERGILLEDAGLISGSTGFTSRKTVFDENGNGFFIGDTWALTVSGRVGIEKTVKVWLLTRAGREVASLLPPTDEKRGLRKVADILPKDDIAKIAMGRIVNRDTTTARVLAEETLWPNLHS
jgi:hypothetical protein